MNYRLAKRDAALDTLRVIAIFGVLLVHTQLLPSFSHTPSDFSLLYSVFFFGKLGVPLFVMISGALLLTQKLDISQFYKHRARRIIVPWLVWAALFFLYTATFSQNLLTISQQFLKTLFSDFWFVPMILGVYLLAPVTKLVVTTFTQRGLEVTLGIWFVLTSLLPAFSPQPLFPGSASLGLLSLSLYYSGYFLLGYYLYTYTLKRLTPLVLVSILVISVFSYIAIANLTASNADHLFFIVQDYFSPLLVLGSASLFLLVKTAHNQKASKVVQSLSTISYGIFLSHTLLSRFFFSSSTEELTLPTNLQVFLATAWMTKTVLLFIISAAIIFVLQKLIPIKKLVT